jgi:hypothetical protein
MTGPDSFSYFRAKLRLGLAYDLSRNPIERGGFFTQFDIEPAARLGAGFASSFATRAALGYAFSKKVSIDLRYIRDWDRETHEARFKPSANTVKVTLNYWFGHVAPRRPEDTEELR